MNELYRHKKTGGVYEVLTRTAKIQCSTYPEFEEETKYDPWVVYRDIIDHSRVYFRLYSEFNDGRFEKLYSEQTGGAG